MKNGPDRIKFWKQRGEPKKDAPTGDFKEDQTFVAILHDTNEES